MSIMINPIIPQAMTEPEIAPAGRKNLQDRTFADHYDRELEIKSNKGKDKLGVQSDRRQDADDNVEPAETKSKKKTLESSEKNVASLSSGQDQRKEESSIENTVASLLGDFMKDLKEVANTKDITPGEWVAFLPDIAMLQQVASDAGMDEFGMSPLLQQLEANGGQLQISDFLGLLEQHFNGIQNVPEITVSETELPMLEALLLKMGIGHEEVASLANQSVKSEGRLDLTLFLEGLQHLQSGDALHSIQLTDWESEQLQNLLAQAGVSQNTLTELFPEHYLEKILASNNDGFEFSLERLQDMLQKGLADIDQNRPMPNLHAFLKNLDQVLSQSEYNETGVGWTPVIQQSLAAVYQELQDVFEQAMKKFSEELNLEDTISEEELHAWQKSIIYEKTNSNTQDFPSNMFSGNQFNELAPSVLIKETFPAMSSFPAFSDMLSEVQQVTNPQESYSPARTPYQLQNQVFQQVTAAVMHGIRNDEHHLILRLYPQELGEVKVDLLVKNEQISITFNMENSKVKEMLESNMEEFRENMEQKGFSLGECSVQVGNRDDFDNQWQRFFMSGQAGSKQRETLDDLPDDVLYLQGDSFGLDGRKDGLSVFV